jgi:hypothetical protein
MWIALIYALAITLIGAFLFTAVEWMNQTLASPPSSKSQFSQRARPQSQIVSYPGGLLAAMIDMGR